MSSAPAFVLASQSAARARMLTMAGLEFATLSAKVDEEAVKSAMLAEGATPAHVAETLAELKAVRPSANLPGALVLGSDQVLVAEGMLYSKPETLAEARAQLQALRGKTHELITAAVIARDGVAVWRHVARVRLVMRSFSDEFIDWYLGKLGDRALQTVGCYEIEGLGSTLFARVDGDPYVIQGLPLLAVLDFLRSHKVAMA
ncbi:Maf family protein [Govanella unica]|uniref:Nucleoside triphosphate pyrophosphatase n=1 Tax=Govanella unica TaxID=2975056 RepID=A0A9X3Z5S7_9PROT|nr:Maf family protein [Govania unica]MDA5192377.1 Maf family protein [Govania unica]